MTCHFHARYSAKNKTYHYLISQKLDVMRGHLIHFVPSGINYPKLVEALKLFVGTHDFLSFSQTTKTNSVRTIYWIKFDHRNDLITIKINANGFLHSMVRMLVGAGLAYARNKISWHQLNYALTHPQKGGLGMKAPAAGLYLATVKY